MAGLRDADSVTADPVPTVGGVAVDGGNLRASRRFADRAGAVLAAWRHDGPCEFDDAFRLRAIAEVEARGVDRIP